MTRLVSKRLVKYLGTYLGKAEPMGRREYCSSHYRKRSAIRYTVKPPFENTGYKNILRSIHDCFAPRDRMKPGISDDEQLVLHGPQGRAEAQLLPTCNARLRLHHS